MAQAKVLLENKSMFLSIWAGITHIYEMKNSLGCRFWPSAMPKDQLVSKVWTTLGHWGNILRSKRSFCGWCKLQICIYRFQRVCPSTQNISTYQRLNCTANFHWRPLSTICKIDHQGVQCAKIWNLKSKCGFIFQDGKNILFKLGLWIVGVGRLLSSHAPFNHHHLTICWYENDVEFLLLFPERQYYW